MPRRAWSSGMVPIVSRAAERADELLAERDPDGSELWRRIVAAIDELRWASVSEITGFAELCSA
jgi:hypothetical protein